MKQSTMDAFKKHIEESRIPPKENCVWCEKDKEICGGDWSFEKLKDPEVQNKLWIKLDDEFKLKDICRNCFLDYFTILFEEFPIEKEKIRDVVKYLFNKTEEKQYPKEGDFKIEEDKKRSKELHEIKMF